MEQEMPEDVGRFVSLVSRLNDSVRRDLRCPLAISEDCKEYYIYDRHENFCCLNYENCDIYKSGQGESKC